MQDHPLTDYDKRVRTAFDLGRLEYQHYHAITPLIALYEGIAIGRHFDEIWWRSLPTSSIQGAMEQVFNYCLADQPSLSHPPIVQATDLDDTYHDHANETGVDAEPVIVQMYQLLRWIWTCDVASLQNPSMVCEQLSIREIPFNEKELHRQHKKVIETRWALFPDALLEMFLTFSRMYAHEDYSLSIAFLLIHIGYRTGKPYAPPLLFATTAAQFSNDHAWRTMNAVPIEDWRGFTIRWLARTASLTERNIDHWVRDHKRLHQLITKTKHPRKHAEAFLALLVECPITNTQCTSKHLQIPPTSSTYNLVSYFEELGVIVPTDNKNNYRIYTAPALTRPILRGEIECPEE